MQQQQVKSPGIAKGVLTQVHHIAFNVKDMEASRYFYGKVLGLHELEGDEVPSTLIKLKAAGKVTNFRTPDGTIVDLFAEPELSPPHPDPQKQFTRANHLAFGIAPEHFDDAVETIKEHQIAIASDVVSRPTGRGFYFYDPDGFMVEIRCDPLT